MMPRPRRLALAALAGGALFAGCDQARAAILLDFVNGDSYSLPVRLGVPEVVSPYLSYYVSSDRMIVPGSAFTVPIAPGTLVFDLAGEVLAATAATLTNGTGLGDYPDAYSFVGYLGPGFGSGVGFREAYDFFPGQTTDLEGAVIEGIRITLSDICLQPTGDPVCPRIGAGNVGFRYGIRFQVFGTPAAAVVPEPAALALLGAGLVLLGAARLRRG